MSFSITFIFFILPLIICSYYLLWRPTSLWSGFWASYCIGTLFFLGIVQIEKINQRLAFFIALPFALLLMAILLFGIFVMIIALFWNEKILLKHESLSLGNLLPIILAVVLIIFEIIMLFFSHSIENTIILELFSFFNLCFVYFGSLFLFYGITTVLYNLFPVVGKVDYIIVLGAGLKGKELTPLLASRVDRGVKLYRKQQLKGYQPVFILSGGKGSDEAISEAEAMKRYLEKKHQLTKNILLEDQSTNTEENIRFSQKLVIETTREPLGLIQKKVVIATSNYHLLRAGKLAKQQSIQARGVGSKTRLYYLPTAYIREYIGYLFMTKKIHLSIIGGTFVISLGVLLLQFFTS